MDEKPGAAATLTLSRPEPRAGQSETELAYLAGPPLFWRLLAANLFVVLGGAVVGTALTQQFVLSGSFTPLTHALMVLAAIALSAILTAVILHVAFRPLRELRAAIADSAAGRYGDPDILAVAEAVHGLWDRLDQHVRLLEASNRRLEEQRRELAEKTAQLQQLASMVLAAQEEERRRIARELHDETMQSLAALIMGLERGLQAMPADVPHLSAAHRTVARLRDLAEQTLEELRHLALDLRPSVLDDHGLAAAVRWLAETFQERSGVETSVEIDPVLEDRRVARPDPTVETALFRIVQEALANVAKHAQAAHAVVRLRLRDGRLVAEVEDDGIGLPEPWTHSAPPAGSLEPMEPMGHMGLLNMRERAALAGGTCAISRGSGGRGTLVRAIVPATPGRAAAASDPSSLLSPLPYAGAAR